MIKSHYTCAFCVSLIFNTMDDNPLQPPTIFSVMLVFSYLLQFEDCMVIHNCLNASELLNDFSVLNHVVSQAASMGLASGSSAQGAAHFEHAHPERTLPELPWKCMRDTSAIVEPGISHATVSCLAQLRRNWTQLGSFG